MGFAAETEQVEAHALLKLQLKRLDMIVGNRVGAQEGFQVDENCLWVKAEKGEAVILGPEPKRLLADHLFSLIISDMKAKKRLKMKVA